jgi:hypothetical protein
MLVARRDPPLHPGEYDHSRAHVGHAHHSRFMTAVQVIGTLVGIPVGLASVYSIYHSNFTVEARCETLRGGIISMLDKRADASTLRMLVRRDVVTFENNCGSVDPDAVKAFKALLAERPPTVAPVAHATPTPAVAPSQQVTHEPSHQPAEIVKQATPPKAAPAPTIVEARPGRRDSETSDATWINSVRDALTHAPAQDDAIAAPVKTPVAAQPAPPVIQATPVAPPPPHVVHETPAPQQPQAIHEAAPLAAPALPAPLPITAAPAPVAAADHPVPPGSIPDAEVDAEPTGKPGDKPGHSWMANIPILNRVVGH